MKIMIIKNYTNNKQNSRASAIYASIKSSVSKNSCPNCWGTQEYDKQRLDAKEFTPPKKSYEPISLIQKLAKGFVNNSETNCVSC